MKTTKRVKLLTKIINKTSGAKVSVQRDFVDKCFLYSTPKLEKVAKSIKVSNRGKNIDW